MPKAISAGLRFLAAFALIATACQALSPQAVANQTPGSPQTTASPTQSAPTPTPQPASPTEQVVQITGQFTYTNEIITTYYVEQAVALVDMYGFVQRDQAWEIPVDSQTLGFLDLNREEKTGAFRLDLPAQPSGEQVDVDQDDQPEEGVQVFTVAYWPNLAGGPYSGADDPSFGWPTYLASVTTDPENQDEVTGGDLVVWSPGDLEQFPTGFGDDGLLFTGDDPVGAIPAGYSIVNLDQQPFEIIRSANAEVTLYEPQDVAIKDYSAMTYTEAFDALVEKLRVEYAFSDVPDKAPDWDALINDLRPRIQQAEADNDPQAFYLALRDFIWAFQDGHVGLNGGEIENQVFSQESDGGYGFALRELDDGRFMVIYVLPGGPADQAGIKVGAEVTQFNDQPVGDAVAQVTPLSAPFSTEFALRYQQARYLLRAPVGTDASVTFANPGSSTTQTVSLLAIAERESFAATSIYRGFDPNALPVEYEITESGVGVVRINSNYDDLNLIYRLFERALQVFQANQVIGIIIDLRQNAGGAFLGLAGFLTDQEVPMGQLEYYSEKTGQFEPDGIRDMVRPFPNQYRFGKMALLVSQACASACELEAYGFSQVPGMVVVGETPTAGVEAEVARGQFLLPEGFSLQAPTGRFTLPDGSIFLEGQGVAPTLTVPITEENVLSPDDVILRTAEDAILIPEGAGVTPSGPPQIALPEEARDLLQQGIPALEDYAREQYTNTSQAGETYTYTIALEESEPLVWLNGWCATTPAILEENYQHIEHVFTLDGAELTADQLASIDFLSDGRQCRYYYTVLDEWPAGEHHLTVDVTFNEQINDGESTYPQGTHTYEYMVFVKP